jgi:hypothetical protein
MNTSTQRTEHHLVQSYGVPLGAYYTYETTANWAGHVEESKADHLGCSSSKVHDAFWFNRKDQTLSFTKLSGQSFTVVGSLGITGASAQVSTDWSKSVQQTFDFNLADVDGFHYCLGGVGGTWLTGRQVAVTTRPRSHNGGGCPPPSTVVPGQRVTYSRSERTCH